MILFRKVFATQFFFLLQDAQFAAKSLLSYDQLGSQNNWPISHQHPAWKESLQYLSNENTFLRQQLAARADTKFIKGTPSTIFSWCKLTPEQTLHSAALS